MSHGFRFDDEDNYRQVFCWYLTVLLLLPLLCRHGFSVCLSTCIQSEQKPASIDIKLCILLEWRQPTWLTTAWCLICGKQVALKTWWGMKAFHLENTNYIWCQKYCRLQCSRLKLSAYSSPSLVTDGDWQSLPDTCFVAQTGASDHYLFCAIQVCALLLWMCFLRVTEMCFGKALVMMVATIWQTNLDGRSVTLSSSLQTEVTAALCTLPLSPSLHYSYGPWRVLKLDFDAKKSCILFMWSWNTK